MAFPETENERQLATAMLVAFGIVIRALDRAGAVPLENVQHDMLEAAQRRRKKPHTAPSAELLEKLLEWTDRADGLEDPPSPQ